MIRNGSFESWLIVLFGGERSNGCKFRILSSRGEIDVLKIIEKTTKKYANPTKIVWRLTVIVRPFGFGEAQHIFS